MKKDPRDPAARGRLREPHLSRTSASQHDSLSESSNASSLSQQQLLTLELRKLQKQAHAARLEARAAELECLISRLAAGEPMSSIVEESRDLLPSNFDDSAAAEIVSPRGAASQAGPTKSSTPRRLDATNASADVSGPKVKPRRPPQQAAKTTDRRKSSKKLAPQSSPAQNRQPVEINRASGQNSSSNSEPCDRTPTRRPNRGWLLSVLFHLGLLIVLALVSLRTQPPRDQISLAAASATEEMMPVESVSIEAAAPVAEPAPTELAEPQYNLDLTTDLDASVFSSEALRQATAPSLATWNSSADGAALAQQLSGESSDASQFCGVSGGGNHFVYLVDSSRSMGKAFESARAELLTSIDALKPEQRFYVIFFDANSEFMRLSDAQKDEPTSVLATTENKQALHRWAEAVKMDEGRAPYDALRFALNLKPDVIFLLSDGEFPERIETLLQEENHISNLFGDRQLISIVHTIGYHSRAGEARMRRIAAMNQGQYRHIAAPR